MSVVIFVKVLLNERASRYHYVALDIPCISIVTYVLNAPDTMGITHVITTFVFKSTRVFALWAGGSSSGTSSV